eukprot:2753956-Rhodomonas_salina.1
MAGATNITGSSTGRLSYLATECAVLTSRMGVQFEPMHFNTRETQRLVTLQVPEGAKGGGALRYRPRRAIGGARY